MRHDETRTGEVLKQPPLAINRGDDKATWNGKALRSQWQLIRGVTVLVALTVFAGVSRPAASAAGETPRVYGDPGSLGPRGNFAAVPVPGWGFDPGQAAYFPAVASDGTTFVANLPQTFNQFLPTACGMVITCFNPDRPVCDDGAGGGSFFSNLHVPDVHGALELPAGCPLSTRLQAGASGADVSDVEVIADANVEGGERVVFTSAWGAATGRRGFPAFGSLTKRDGRWTVDLAARRWSDDLSRSSPAGAAACPMLSDGDAWCGSFSEMEQLPRSGRLVIGQYAPPGLIVIDGTGRVLANYRWAPMKDPCDSGRDLMRAPREIDVDPTGAIGDERFVVVFDTSDGRGQPLQEFRYDETRTQLTPVSAAIAPQSGVGAAPSCAGQRQVVVAQYDSDGNLWAGRGSHNAGSLVGFLKSRATGTRESLVVACSATDPSSLEERPWGVPCSADLDVGMTSRESGDRGPVPLFVNLVEDLESRTLLGVTWTGSVWRLERTPSSGGVAVTWREPADMHLADLQPPAPDELRLPSKGIVDAIRRSLWVPVSTAERYGPEGCGFFTCDPVTGQRRSQYLYEFDLDRLPERGAVSRVDVPERVVEGKQFSVTIHATLPGTFARRASEFSLFDEDSAEPITNANWRRHCSGAACRFTVKLPPRVTRRRGGRVLSWHASLVDDTGASLNTTGVVTVVR